MPINKKLLKKTLHFIETHPEKHNQEMWCGTAKCFAGWACALDGWEEASDDTKYAIDDLCWESQEEVGFDIDYAVVKDEMIGDVKQVAANLLGLDEAQAFDLFYHSNRIEHLRAYVKQLCNLPEESSTK